MSLSISQRIAELIQRGEELLATSFCGQEPSFHQMMRQLRELQRQAKSVPGCASSPKARAGIDDICAYCETVSLTALDGQWFFDKCEGCGWMNGKNPIVDWRATVRAWKLIKVFPSQKMPLSHANGFPRQPLPGANAPIDRMIAMKEFERVEIRIKNLREGLPVYGELNPKDKAELKRLRDRKGVLMKQLGMEI